MNSIHTLTRKAALAVGAAAILSLPLNSQAADGWLVDFEKAKAQAAKEGKSILMEFTGSDWCPPCIQLEKNVLSQEAFKTGAPKNFILLKLDSPRDKSKQTPEDTLTHEQKDDSLSSESDRLPVEPVGVND